tara:strand:+ start:44 stop:559 length:516 start_codon:yes stop_codon:yes gene_type:complete
MPNKKNIQSVEVLVDKISKANSIYFTDYLGLSVADITKLRREFYLKGVEFIVVKNSLLKIASEKNKISLNDDLFMGSTAIAISYEEPVSAAKVIKDFSKEYELPKVKGILFEGTSLPGEEFKRIASLPSKEESLVQFMVMIKSPMRDLSLLLKSQITSVVNLLNNVKQTKS